MALTTISKSEVAASNLSLASVFRSSEFDEVLEEGAAAAAVAVGETMGEDGLGVVDVCFGEKTDQFGGESEVCVSDEMLEPEVTAETSGASSFGRDRASATTLALPSRYRMSVVYSEMHPSWYVCLNVWGSVFLCMLGIKD